MYRSGWGPVFPQPIRVNKATEGPKRSFLPELPDEPHAGECRRRNYRKDGETKRRSDLCPISRWGWTEKEKCQEKQINSDLPVLILIYLQALGPNMDAIWAHLRKNLFLHSPNWEPPLSHERHRQQSPLLTIKKHRRFMHCEHLWGKFQGGVSADVVQKSLQSMPAVFITLKTHF